MPASTIVRLVPKLSISALKAKLDKALALWYCLWARNHCRSGRFDPEDAVGGLTSVFDYSRSTAYRILGTGDGIFGEERPLKSVNRLQIEIYGVKRVARYSGYPSPRCLVEIPILRSVRYEGQSVIQL